jgi:hypothetical protein
MKTTRMAKKISEIYDGYKDNGWDGVTGFGGKLDIRPKYQREFIYDLENERAVISTILKGHPLNIMYWVKTGEDNFELLDGQQRTLSICRFLDHKYHILDKDGNKIYVDTMLADDLEKLKNYKLDICVCEGSEGEILDWFKTINIKGKELNEQEALNATHTGLWLSDAKRYFSKPDCAAYRYGKDYVSGSVERQDYLRTALSWISGGDVQGYMAKHRNDANADKLWNYYRAVIDWVKLTFTTYRNEMRGLNWGEFYNEHKNDTLDAAAIEKKVKELMADDDVQKKSGVYGFVLTGDETYLNLRQFDPSIARAKYEQQKGICPMCGKHFEFEEMHADHIKPWSKGGKTVAENCQMLCASDNLRKSNGL